MRAKAFLRAVAAVGLPMVVGLGIARPVWAGDPCPIRFDVHDLGSPPWLDRQATLAGLQTRVTWLGINYDDHARPIELTQVHPGSPADRAGLRPGDVLRRVGAIEIVDEPTVRQAFAALVPGRSVEIEVRRGEETHAYALTLEFGDPLVRRFVADNRGRFDCIALRQSPDDPPFERVAAAVLDPHRRFRCGDAHRRLREAFPPDAGADGDVVFVRGRRRVLVVVVGWESRCVRANAYDGEALTTQRVQQLFDEVAGDLVADRHRHP